MKTEELKMVSEWDKTFPKSEKVEHKKITFVNRYGITLAADMYTPNDAFAQYFTGKSYLAPVSVSQIGIYNVTFEPGCRNNWHVHHASEGGGQILVCVAGRGYYQE